MLPLTITLIIPCRNEAKFIAQCLDSILANTYPKECLEVLIIDGMSDDGTRDVIRVYAARHAFIRLLDNQNKITPSALNIGIRFARGEIVMRMDVHVTYPTNYISGLLSALMETGADNAGGLCNTVPTNNTVIGQAIAIAMAHPFGVGNSYFRIGVSEPRWVDTVPFGCYRKEVFDRIGLFDEKMVRNEDDEFNLRLIKHGGKILLVPHIVSYYYARDSLRKLWRMYSQYGYFKPLVVSKIGRVLTIRQLVPSAFVSCLFLLAALGLWSGLALTSDEILLFTYVAANFCVSWITAARTKTKSALALPLVFPVLHFGYGLGFLKGAFNLLLFRKFDSKTLASVGLTR